MKRTHGFTLVELALVLFIVSLVLGAILGPLGTRLEAEEREKTQAVMENMKEALYGFAAAPPGRLPCPDTDNPPDGQENPPGGAGGCNALEGVLPWVTLGVEQRDSWRQNYRYRVTGAFADNTAAATGTCPLPASGASFNLCDNGYITVLDASAGNPVANQIPALILSYGSNQNDPNQAINGDLSVHEAENTDTDTTFVMKTYSREDAQEFDDLVVWISPNILKNRMVTAGRLP